MGLIDTLSSKDVVIFHEVVENIDADIKELGYSAICSDAKLLVNGKQGLIDNTKLYSHLNDMVICSVGFSLLRHSELLFFVGPVKGELPVNEEELYGRTASVLEYIEETIKAIKQTGENPIDDAQAVEIDGRMYSFNKASPSKTLEFLRACPLAECYYDYKGIEDFIIVLPVFNDNFSAFKHTASKLRH